MRYKEPEGAERRPGHRSCHIGRPDEGCGIGQGHKQRSWIPVSSSCPMSGKVCQNERTLWSTEVLMLYVGMYSLQHPLTGVLIRQIRLNLSPYDFPDGRVELK